MARIYQVSITPGEYYETPVSDVVGNYLFPDDFVGDPAAEYHIETGNSVQSKDPLGKEDVDKFKEWLLSHGFIPVSRITTNIYVGSRIEEFHK